MACGAAELTAISYATALSLLTALASGLLIGIERGFTLRREHEGTRVAGVRTFTLMGLTGGVAGLLGRGGQQLAAGALVFGAVAVVAIGYSRQASLSVRTDATTAIAAIATLGFGFVAGSGQAGLAIAGATIVTMLLALKQETHRLIDRLDQEDVKALARYAVIAGAVLPFLPNGHYGPLHAWNPQRLWLVVMLVTGFSFLGYVANRIFGERRGTIATALIGGAYSSTAVTQALSQRLGSEQRGGAEVAGIALASAVMYLRVPILIAALATRVLPAISILILPATIVAWVAGIWLYRRAPHNDAPTPPGNPIAFLPALGFVAFVAIAAIAAAWAQGRFGQSGIAALLLIVGSMDIDVAIVTLGSLSPTAISPLLAAIVISGTVIANMAVKIAITFVYARAKAAPAILAMGSSIIVLGIMIALAWTRL